MWVLAKNGKRTEKASLAPDMGCSCSNAADVAVLEWLAAQPAPLYWICSDGQGALRLSRNAPETQEMRENLKRKYKIIRHESLDEFVSAIKGGR
jgi:hypothetical protein